MASVDRLRRLTFQEASPSSLFRDRSLPPAGSQLSRENPFRWMLYPKTKSAFVVCLDSSSAASPDPDEVVAMEQLGNLREELFEVFRTPGDRPPAEWSAVTAMTIGDERLGPSTPVELKTRGHTRGTGVRMPGEWQRIARDWLRDPSMAEILVQVEAANALGAHIFISTSERTVGLRNQQGLTHARNVLTPLEALPVVAAWTRASGWHWHGHTSINVGYFHEALSRALAPNVWDGYRALVVGEYTLANGNDLVELATSCIARLEAATRVLDRLYTVWQLPSDNDTIDELAQTFDQVVLLVSAIHDNLALLAGRYFGLTGLRQFEWSFRDLKFRSKLDGTDERRAQALVELLARRDIDLRLHFELRNHAIHRARLAPIRLLQRGEADQPRLHLYEPLVGELHDLLAAMGDDPEAWGFSHRSGPSEDSVTFIDEPGRTETRRIDGEALLDPMPFSVRLVRRTARLMDEVFAAIDLKADTRLDRRRLRRLATTRLEFPLRPEDASSLILSSPLAGVDPG